MRYFIIISIGSLFFIAGCDEISKSNDVKLESQKKANTYLEQRRLLKDASYKNDLGGVIFPKGGVVSATITDDFATIKQNKNIYSLPVDILSEPGVIESKYSGVIQKFNLSILGKPYEKTIQISNETNELFSKKISAINIDLHSVRAINQDETEDFVILVMDEPEYDYYLELSKSTESGVEFESHGILNELKNEICEFGKIQDSDCGSAMIDMQMIYKKEDLAVMFNSAFLYRNGGEMVCDLSVSPLNKLGLENCKRYR